MIVYFDLQPEYRQKMADLLGSTEANLEPFYSSLESEVAWHLALGGLRESEMDDEEILAQLFQIHETAGAFGKSLKNMSPDLFGWLIDYAPVGLDYQMPFKVVKDPVEIIRDMTGEAVKHFQGKDVTARRSSSADFIRKIASCCEETFGDRPDLESDLFHDIVETMFQALGISEHKDIDALIQEARLPPVIILSEEESHEETVEVIVPENYINAIKK